MAAKSISHTPQHKLSPGSNYADAFWDGQNKGVEIILSRLRKSKDTCEEIKKLYESRASIEQDYGTRLLKLAQNLRVGEFEEDSFAETLSRIPSALETTARAHIDLAQQLKDHLESPLDGFLKDQRDIRKMQQQQIENSKQLKNLHEADVARARDYYQIECTKLISLEKYYFSLSRESTSMDEIIKIEKEIEEQRRMVTVAEQVYKRSVDNFNSVNERWVNDWTLSADRFQEMEFKRVTYLRSTLWSFANMMTSTFSIDEECCDRIRTALEITDVQKDIAGFVKRYGTGTRIPAPLAYEVLYQPTPIPHTTPPSQSSSSVLPIAHVVPAAAVTATVASTLITPYEINDHHQQAPLSAPIPQSTSTLDVTEPKVRGESTPVPVISTNPDEELKSVDRQLEQLEVVQHTTTTTPLSEDEKHVLMQTSPQQLTHANKMVEDKKEEVPLSAESTTQPPLTGVTDQTSSTGPFNNAFKEVEQILNRQSSYDDIVAPAITAILTVKKEDTIDALKTRTVASNRASYASNTQTIPPIMMARSIHSDAIASPVSPCIVHNNNNNNGSSGGEGDFSADIYNALGINKEHASQYDLTKAGEGEENNNLPGKINTNIPKNQLAPLSSAGETPVLPPFESFHHNNNDSHISSTAEADKFKPMPNPTYSNNHNSIIHLASDVPTPQHKDRGSPTMSRPMLDQRPVVGVRTSSLLLARQKDESLSHNSQPPSLNQQEEEDNEDEEDKEYHSRMPRPPPKDEKWVISSIRRPQQLPVRTMNARMFDGTASISRNSVISNGGDMATTSVENSPAVAQQRLPAAESATTTTEENHGEPEQQQHQPKVHRPVTPLTIDIPNAIKPTPDLPQNAAQQVIAEGRRLSQMSPIQQKLNINVYNQQQQQDPNNMMRSYSNNGNGLIEENGGGIRPAPWNEDLSSTEDRIPKTGGSFRSGTHTIGNAPNNNGYYQHNGGHMNYQPGMSAPVGGGGGNPRASSFKLSNQDLSHLQQQQQQQQHIMMQQQQFEEDNRKRFLKKNGKEYSESSIKSNNKDKDNKGRFSLGFFMGGNKKEKKKEKEAAAAAAASAAAINYSMNASHQSDMGSAPPQQQYQQQQQQQQYIGHPPQQQQMQQQQYQQPQQTQMQRPLSQQGMYQQQPQQQQQHESDIKSTHSSINNNSHIPQQAQAAAAAAPMQSPPQQQQQQQQQIEHPPTAQAAAPSFDGSRYLGYAKAQWPFEATIEGEMSFHAEEVLGILRKQTDGWWEAERLEPNVAGQRGLVPGNYMIEAIAPTQ